MTPTQRTIVAILRAIGSGMIAAYVIDIDAVLGIGVLLFLIGVNATMIRLEGP